MILVFIHCNKRKEGKENASIADQIQMEKRKNQTTVLNNTNIKSTNERLYASDGTIINLQNKAPIGNAHINDNSNNNTRINADIDVKISNNHKSVNHDLSNISADSSIEKLFEDLIKNRGNNVLGDDDDLYVESEGKPDNHRGSAFMGGNSTSAGGLGLVRAECHEWTQKQVILWIKQVLLQASLENKVIVWFLREFSKKCINGKDLLKLKQDEKLVDSLAKQFTMENQSYEIWKPIKDAINAMGMPTQK